MNSHLIRRRLVARGLLALGLVTISIGIGLAIAAAARAGSTPVGLLPAGPTSTTITAPGQLVAIALPRARRTSGFVWRLARAYDTRIVREISEADVGTDLVLVFKIVGRGRTALVFALTRGDTSAKAVRSTTHRIRSA